MKTNRVLDSLYIIGQSYRIDNCDLRLADLDVRCRFGFGSLDQSKRLDHRDCGLANSSYKKSTWLAT